MLTAPWLVYISWAHKRNVETGTHALVFGTKHLVWVATAGDLLMAIRQAIGGASAPGLPA